MLVRPCVMLDASMPVMEVIARFARQGYRLDPTHPVVRQVLEEAANRLGVSAEEVENTLARPFWEIGAAIRRQWYANIMWYARPLIEVLPACYSASLETTLLVALDLAETDSMPIVAMPPAGETPRREGVIVDGDIAVAVSLENWGAPPPPDLSADALLDDVDLGDASPFGFDDEMGDLLTGSRRGGTKEIVNPIASPQALRTWPRIDAPNYIPARKPFDVTVGLALKQQTGVSGGQVVIHPPSGAEHVDVTVSLVADGLDTEDGWLRTMRVKVNDPTSASVKFRLVARDPPGPEPVQLVMLEVRYSYDGTVCGVASRPLVIGQAEVSAFDLPQDYGDPWADQPATVSPVTVHADPDVVDLTIEIFKPDGNPATGNYVCHLYSPHAVSCPLGPFPIELDDDAQSFAKTIVTQVRTYARSPAVDNLLESHGALIADKLGPGVMTALREVANLVAPATPAVLLVSADPYVPWELALVDPPLDATRPKYLGAQVLLGRWLRDRGKSSAASPPGRNGAGAVEKPPVQPPAHIAVKHMAVMAGMYMADSGLRRLPEAEAEASGLLELYDAVPLAASLQAVKQLLDARLEHKFQRIGGVETIHFAGHGDYDPSNPDSAVLFLSDGMPLFASLFRSAKYGSEQSPLFFLNACMAGIGDELLGDMGGFPGNCLKGGFGGVLGALWEIDDAVAHKVAEEFWRRALPTDTTEAQPVGEILRELRSKYVPDPSHAPATTYLAYVYYGHPRLRLGRAN